MNNSTKIAVAVAGGYLLGRRKKMKVAILLGSWLLGKRLDVDLKRLGREAMSMAMSAPGVNQLVSDVRGKLVSAGKGAAVSIASTRMDALADRLHDHTATLGGAQDTTQGTDQDADGERRPAGRDEEPDADEDEKPRRRSAADHDDEPEAADTEPAKPRRRSRAADDDEESDRPRRRSRAAADDDSDEDGGTPRRRSRSASGSGDSDGGRGSRGSSRSSGTRKTAAPRTATRKTAARKSGTGAGSRTRRSTGRSSSTSDG